MATFRLLPAPPSSSPVKQLFDPTFISTSGTATPRRQPRERSHQVQPDSGPAGKVLAEKQKHVSYVPNNFSAYLNLLHTFPLFLKCMLLFSAEWTKQKMQRCDNEKAFTKFQYLLTSCKTKNMDAIGGQAQYVFDLSQTVTQMHCSTHTHVSSPGPVPTAHQHWSSSSQRQPGGPVG